MSTATDDQSDKPDELPLEMSLRLQHRSVSPLLDDLIGDPESGEIAVVTALPGESSGDDSVERQADRVQPGNPVDAPEPSRATATEDSLEQELRSDSNSDLEESDSVSILKSEVAHPELTGRQGALSSRSKEKGDSPEQEPLEQLTLSQQYGDVGRLAELDALTQAQQFQLDQHRDYILRSRAEQGQQIDNWKTRYVGLEEQLRTARDRVASLEQQHLASQAKVIPLEAQRDAAQHLTERLQTEILEHRQQKAGLEEQLDLAEVTLREQQDITAAQSRSIVAMQAELSQAQAEVAALETRLSHQGHLRQQLSVEGERDRQERSKARDRQLQLEQETTQMTGQLLRLSEELRQTQKQSKQWRRQAQTYVEQIRNIAQWAAQAEAVPPELMALLEPLFAAPTEALLSDTGSVAGSVVDVEEASAVSSSAAPHLNNQFNTHSNVVSVSEPVERDLVDNSHSLNQGSPSSLDLPNFPQDSV